MNITRWPWITRKRFESEMAVLNHNHRVEIQRERSCINEERKLLDGLIKKLIVIEAKPTEEFPINYQIRVLFSTEIVHQLLEHGDSSGVDRVAESVARQVAFELRTINFSRFPIMRENLPPWRKL